MPLLKKPHRHFLQIDGWLCRSVAKAGYSHCQDAHRSHGQLLRNDGSKSAVALGVCHGSLTHRGWHSSSTVIGDPQLRQSYITPHCMKCRSSHSQARFVSLHRYAPFGFTQQALCKIAFAGAVTSRLHSPVASRPTCSRLSPYWCASVVAHIRR